MRTIEEVKKEMEIFDEWAKDIPDKANTYRLIIENLLRSEFKDTVVNVYKDLVQEKLIRQLNEVTTKLNEF